MHYASAKDCLLKHGMIQQITRGRISAVNHKFLADRIALGDTIGGYEVKESSKPTGEITYSNATPAVSSDKTVADIGPARYDEKVMEAYYFDGGKKVNVGMREICSNCLGSFTYHVCDNPVYRVDFDRVTPVYFGERKIPLTRVRW